VATARIDFKGLGDTAAEEAARAKLKQDAKHAPGPDLSQEACACGAFGPWGDGKAFYCRDHAPPDLRYAAQFFAETLE
jgi:hypothetical protein